MANIHSLGWPWLIRPRDKVSYYIIISMPHYNNNNYCLCTMLHVLEFSDYSLD